MSNNRILFSFLTLCLLSVNTLFGQARPDWIDEEIRAMQYPSEKYLVGYAWGNLIPGENIAHATERIKNTAQGNLLENVRVNMKTSTSSFISSGSIDGQYTENEQFNSQTSKSSVAEIVGMKTESYFDKKSKTVYVLAYADRYEVADYHKKLLQFNLSQVEGLLATANKLSSQKDRASARAKCTEALSLFSKIDESQTLLIAIGGTSVSNDIQQDRAKNLYKNTIELQSKLDPKYEILEGLGNELSQKLMQVESRLKTSRDLVNDGEKAKAKQQCESAQNIMSDVRKIQETMRATNPSVSVETLEQHRTEKLYNEIKILSAQLSQAIMVYVESTEDLFGKQVNVIASKLKAQMASNGCSFTDDVSKADFKLTMTCETREGSANENLVFCYADVNLDFFDTHKQKSIYSDDISEKGGSTTKEKAARKAMEKAADKIMEGITPWLR